MYNVMRQVLIPCASLPTLYIVHFSFYILPVETKNLLSGYDFQQLTVGVLGGHSALDVCHGAKQWDLKTVCVARKGREKTYERYFKTRGKDGDQGCIDDVVVVDQFADVLDPKIQKQLRELNTVFVHNRYFWVYFDDFSKVENA